MILDMVHIGLSSVVVFSVELLNLRCVLCDLVSCLLYTSDAADE